MGDHRSPLRIFFGGAVGGVWKCLQRGVGDAAPTNDRRGWPPGQPALCQLSSIGCSKNTSLYCSLNNQRHTCNYPDKNNTNQKAAEQSSDSLCGFMHLY